MSAIDDLGPHLLGWVPSPPDARDYAARLWLPTATPLEQALATLLSSHAAKATKEWAALATPLIEGIQPPAPPAPTPVPPVPPAPDAVVYWSDVEQVLDQGQTVHCVGFCGAQWGNTVPVDDHFTNADGDRLYYACKVFDKQPKQENGSDSRSLAKALQASGRLSTYAFAASVEEIIAWLQNKGSVMIGSDWTNDMFEPNAHGFVSPTGGVAGGHEYLADAYDPAQDAIGFLNSWGDSWSLKGRFWMQRADFASLWANNGEALVAVELP